MSRSVLILRPEPGASATAARAVALGLDPIKVPLFTVAARSWTLPSAQFDAVLMTSTNAARLGGAQLRALAGLPLYAVGTATAAAAREAGFGDVREAGPDVMASYNRLSADGCRSVLHLAGEHVTQADPGALQVQRMAVYAAEAIEPAPALADALARDPVTLVHSSRAARRFAECAERQGVARASVRAAAISATAAGALGQGWGLVEIAPAPTDDALLETAARMCD